MGSICSLYDAETVSLEKHHFVLLNNYYFYYSKNVDLCQPPTTLYAAQRLIIHVHLIATYTYMW